MEWMLVGIFLLKFSNDFRKSLAVEESEAVEVHRQRLSYKKDEMIERLEEARKLFLERGVKSPLIISISRVLVDAGWSEDRIAALLSPLISYEDEKIPRLVFGWEKNMIGNKNRRKRIKILKEIEEKMSKEGVGIGS
jgi:signal recognition particle subunit SEC65